MRNGITGKGRALVPAARFGQRARGTHALESAPGGRPPSNGRRDYLEMGLASLGLCVFSLSARSPGAALATQGGLLLQGGTTFRGALMLVVYTLCDAFTWQVNTHSCNTANTAVTQRAGRKSEWRQGTAARRERNTLVGGSVVGTGWV